MKPYAQQSPAERRAYNAQKQRESRAKRAPRRLVKPVGAGAGVVSKAMAGWGLLPPGLTPT